ncbi:hypothetical protein N9D61_04400 [Planktomarina sp.]|nr:hypothetical protein [Planktomarina sp.]
MVTKIYDGSTTQQLTFDASSSTENILQVSNITGWSEYRDGDDLVLFSSNATDYLRVVGAYADATRLEYIEYLFDGGSSSKYLVSEIDDVPSSGAHFFAGTSANDVITTSPADPSSATGYLGDDQITGSSGTDYLGGNEGDDILSGGAGDDVLTGGAGDDTLDGGAGDDTLDGGSGDDTLIGGAGDDTLDGGAGDDTYQFAHKGIDTITDISGSDTLVVESVGENGDYRFRKLYQDSDDLILEGSRDGEASKVTMSGVENITWQAADDSYSDYTMTLGISGEASSDTNRMYVGTLGDDTLITGQGDYVEGYGADGDDTITILGGGSWASGDAGHDTLIGGEGNDTLHGDFGSGFAGNDILKGNGGDDNLIGSDGNDTLDGGSGDDTLIGGAGDDTLDGGAGDDTLEGGSGNDTLDGGAGDDVYEYWGYEGFDVISETSGFDTIVFKDAHSENAGWGSPFQEGYDLVYIADNGISGFRVTDHFSDPDKSIELFEYERSGYSVLVRNSDQEIVDPFGNYDELLVGTVGNDVIIAAAGDNIIHDEIYGYDGDDTIDNSVGNKSWIEAGTGDDVITGGAFEDQIRGQSGDDKLSGKDGNDTLFGGAGNDSLDGGAGYDVLNGGAGNDTLNLSADGVYSYKNKAQNATSEFQVGTGELVRLKGKKKISDVMDGGADIDTIVLTDSADAFFLHDNFGGFHSSLTLVEDYDSRLGTARIANIENINSGAGDDIVDLTSPDYSLAGQDITVDGGSGNDTLWGSDANETLLGGDGNDELFGGAGTNVLTGGLGADEFQFTKTSTNDTVKDFSPSDGDTLKFFNTGGAQFDLGSVSLNSAGDELSISDGTGVLTITLEGAGLQLDDLGHDVLIIG